MGAGSSEQYDAFISYSHAADGLLSPRLQTALQVFAKPWWRRRALRVFRDDASLSANPHLWTSITDALDGSRWLVLLLSPEAAASEWVDREVAYWVREKPANHILPILTDGSFEWDRADGRLAATATVPPALLDAFAEEPRWIDLRWAREETQLDLRNSRFRGAVADVASAIREVAKDDLESEEVHQHRRTVRTAWGAGIALLLLAVASVVAAIYAGNQREEAERHARVAEARGLAARAVATVPTRIDQSLLLAVEAIRTDDNRDTRDGLLHALNGARHLGQSHNGLPHMDAFHVWPDTTAAYDGEQVTTLRTGTWEQVGQPIALSGGLLLNSSAEAARVSTVLEGAIRVHDTATGDQVGPVFSAPDGTDMNTATALSEDGELLAVHNIELPGLDVTVHRVDDGTEVGTFSLPGDADPFQWGFAEFDTEATSIILTIANELAVFDLASGQRTAETELEHWGEYTQPSPDGSVMAVVTFVPPQVTLLDGQNLTPIAPPQRPASGGRIGFVSFNADGSLLAIGTDDGAATILDSQTGEVRHHLRAPTGTIVGGGWVSRDGFIIASETAVTEWDLSSPSPIGSGTSFEGWYAYPGVTFFEETMVLSAEGRLRYTLDGTDHDVALPGECPQVDPLHNRDAVLVTCSDGEVTTVAIVDLTSETVDVVTEYGGPVNARVSPDDAQIAVIDMTGAGWVSVIETEGGEVVMPERVMDEWTLLALGWEPSGEHLLVGGQDGDLIFFDTGSWEETARITLEPARIALFDLVFDPGQPKVHVSSESGRLWTVDLESMQVDGEPLSGGATQLQEMAVSPDGSTLMAASRDGATRFWDAERRTLVGPPLAWHVLTTRGAEWGPDGPISIGLDAQPTEDDPARFSVVEWELDPNRLTEVACELVGRNLTMDEWEQFVPDTDYRLTCPDNPGPNS